MEILRMLEARRTPLLDDLFALLTLLGDETILIGVGFIFLWSVDKRLGYRIIYLILPGMMVNQYLKSVFRVPRPWILDPEFSIVENARMRASGYSFPSGHTQAATSFYGAIAKFIHNRGVRWAMVLLILLVGFSRMYLGVHTPLDVGVSWLLGAVLVLALAPVVQKATDQPRVGLILSVLYLICSLLYVAVLELQPLPSGSDPLVAQDSLKNAYTLLGITAAMPIAWQADHRLLRYDVRAKWWVQIFKCILGLSLLGGLRIVLKEPLLALTGGHPIADTVRYALIVLFGGSLWPMTFKAWAKL